MLRIEEIVFHREESTSVSQYQMIRPENAHTNDIIQPDQVRFMYSGISLNISISTYVATDNEKEALNIKRSKGGIWEGLEGRK